MTKKILVLPGDGIGPEIVGQATKVLDLLIEQGLDVSYDSALVGGSSFDAHGVPLTDEVLQQARDADALLLGAVGGPQWEGFDIAVRPEKALLKLRSELELFGNLRPAILYPQLADASSLKPELVENLDLMIIRELTGGIYFGQPRGVRTLDDGEKEGYNTYVYSESEVERIAHVAFRTAMLRDKRLCSVDKANVLEATELWREVMDRVAKEYPEVELTHMYVDNAAMQLVRAPKQFDVMVTGNMFGDILSDCAAMLTGSIGMLPSASLDIKGKGMYEPIHGSAPDIAGENKANPIATILSVSMMLRHSFGEAEVADKIDAAVSNVLDQGMRTADIYTDGDTLLSTSEMGDAIIAALK